jgi:hypothetical protein
MAHEGLHSWSAQVFGNGYTETRERYFDSNGALVEAEIFVRWDDGTASAAVYTFRDGSFSTTGQLRYPDDTHASAQYFPDGHFNIVHGHNDGSTSAWRYNADGSGFVENRQTLDVGTDAIGFATTSWTLNPDGSPVGDFWDYAYWTNSATGQSTEHDSRKTPDGTTTVKVQVWDANGNLISVETTTTHPQPELEPVSEAVPTSTRPIPLSGSTRPAVDTIVKTTRAAPISSLSGGGGWSGGTFGGGGGTFGGGGGTEHRHDWWLVTPDGRTHYLGSSRATTKEAEHVDH